MEDKYDVWMSKNHLREFKIVNRTQFPGFIDKLRKEIEQLELKKAKALQKKLAKDQKRINGEPTSSSESDSSSSDLSYDRDDENLGIKKDHQNLDEDEASNQPSAQDADESDSGSESSPYESGQSSND